MLDAFKIKKLNHLSFNAKSFLSVYPWKNCEPPILTTLDKPLNQCKVSIVSSAGLYIKGEQKKFDNNIKGGDYSYRIIPNLIEIKSLDDAHRSESFNHKGLKSNPETGMPIPQLKILEKENLIGTLNDCHISIMGSIFVTGRFIKNTVPKLVNLLLKDKVDCILLVPV